MPKREFMIGKTPVMLDGREMREIKTSVDMGPWKFVLMVDAREPIEALEAIRAVYGLGQEDTAQTPETATEAPEVKPAPVSYPDDDEAPETPVHIRLLGRQDTPYRIGLGRWIDVIHVANGLWPGMFGAAESEDKWVEEYHDASVVFREDGTASVIAKTNRGDRTLRAAAAFLGVTTGN